MFDGLRAGSLLTQRIKEGYSAHHGGQPAGKTAVTSALSLYLNFINLFQLPPNITGQRGG